jgi:hypothetical protein
MENCIHGIVKDWCGLCNGSLRERDEKIAKLKQDRLDKIEWNKKRKELQKASMVTAIRHKEPLTDEELEKILVYTVDEPKENIDLLFNLAMETKRRLGAMEWIWNVAWDEDFTEYDTVGEDNELYNRVDNIKRFMGV